MRKNDLFQRKNEEWLEEYREFSEVVEVTPPAEISDRVLTKIKGLMNPSGVRVFWKLFGIHLLVGSISLVFCPQFGIGYFKEVGLTSFFMQFGEHVCMMACGATFLGVSALVSSLFLSKDEVRKLRKWGVLQLGLLSFLSLIGFILLGEGVVIGMTALWYLGSLLGGLISIEIGLAFRTHLVSIG